MASTVTIIAISFALFNNILSSRDESHNVNLTKSIQPHVLCETTWTLVYNDPSKYDESKIMNELKENLSNDDFSDCVNNSQPWTFVSISKPDVHGIVKLTLPTASLNSSQKITKIMKIFSKMEGISLSNVTHTWIT
jgi:hypothetical protein